MYPQEFFCASAKHVQNQKKYMMLRTYSHLKIPFTVFAIRWNKENIHTEEINKWKYTKREKNCAGNGTRVHMDYVWGYPFWGHYFCNDSLQVAEARSPRVFGSGKTPNCVLLCGRKSRRFSQNTE